MKTLLLLCGSFFIALSATAQGRIVTGRVTGSDGFPLPGVHVAVKGTALGTITNDAGKYSISLPVGGGGGGVLSSFFAPFSDLEGVGGVGGFCGYEGGGGGGGWGGGGSWSPSHSSAM